MKNEEGCERRVQRESQSLLLYLLPVSSNYVKAWKTLIVI